MLFKISSNLSWCKFGNLFLKNLYNRKYIISCDITFKLNILNFRSETGILSANDRW